MTSLVVGGTSGLGLEIAKRFQETGNEVLVTGRHDPHIPSLQFEALDLNGEEVPRRISELVLRLPEVNTLIYAAGFFQDGRITDLDDRQVEEMLNVGGRGLIYFVRDILRKQGKLDELITITSTSQWTPRQREPIYNFVKAGEAMLSNSLAEDGRIDKVLVAGPGGMDTAFWAGTKDKDMRRMLDPHWVASEIMKLREDDYRYCFVKVLRDPARVEVVESR